MARATPSCTGRSTMVENDTGTREDFAADPSGIVRFATSRNRDEMRFHARASAAEPWRVVARYDTHETEGARARSRRRRAAACRAALRRRHAPLSRRGGRERAGFRRRAPSGGVQRDRARPSGRRHALGSDVARDERFAPLVRARPRDQDAGAAARGARAAGDSALTDAARRAEWRSFFSCGAVVGLVALALARGAHRLGAIPAAAGIAALSYWALAALGAE